MPQLDILVYFHEFSWLIISFFLFYFIFLKFFLPKLVTWIKFENKLILYHLNLFKKMNQLIIQSNLNNIYQNLYKLFLCLNLLTHLKTIYNINYKLNINLTLLERTQFLMIKRLK